MTGIVYLVGAGPGAPDLISLRGIRVLRRADVILCDNLLPRSFLEQIGVPTAGKNVIWRGDDAHAMRQPEINRILCEEAGKGLMVARLKNGDPLIFGRASEEIAALNEHGIPWVVVPGISACTAAPAGAGLMLTDRGDSRSFTVSSAVCVGGIPNEDYPVTDSLALLMGVKSLDAVVARLINNGWPPDTPVAIIERASLPFERHVSSTLSHIAEAAAAADISPPAVILLGKAALSKSGVERKRILFTGLDPSGFLGLGQLQHWPALTVLIPESVQAAYADVFCELKQNRFTTIIFTGKLGVTLFFQAIRNAAMDARLLGGTQVIAAGQSTALELVEQGIRPDLVCCNDAVREVPAALDGKTTGNVLLVKAGVEGHGLEVALRQSDIPARSLVTHHLIPHPLLGRPLPDHDTIYFVSPSGVNAYWNAYGKDAFTKEVVCIGTATQAAVNALGIQASICNPYLMW